MVHFQGSQPGGQFLQSSQQGSQQESFGQQSHSQPFREHFRHSQGSQPEADFGQSLHLSHVFMQPFMVHLQGSQPGGQFLQPSQEASQQVSLGQQSQSQPFREHFRHSQGSQPDSDFRQSLHFLQDFLQASMEHLHGSHPGGQFLQPSHEASQQVSFGQQSHLHPLRAHLEHSQGSQPDSDFRQFLHCLQTFLQAFIEHLHGSQPGGQVLQPSQAEMQHFLWQQSQVQPSLAHLEHLQGSQPDSSFGHSLQLLQIFLQESILQILGSQPGGHPLQPRHLAGQQFFGRATSIV